MKQTPNEQEGAQAFARFDATVKTLLSVPRSELLRREAEYKKQAALKPKRGPKPRLSNPAST